MREAQIESYLRDEIKRLGGRAYKFVSPGHRGVPDRLVLLPGGHVVFVELKAPGRTSTALQAKQQHDMRALGCRVEVISTKAGVDAFVSSCREVMSA